MDRRNLAAGLMVLVSSILLLAGTASAHAKVKPQAEPPTGLCTVKTMPSSFIDQGEFDTSSSVADVIEVECNPEYGESLVQLSAAELYERCGHRLIWFSPYELALEGEEGEDAVKGKIKSKVKSKLKHDFTIDGPSDTVYLDNDGNATVVVLGGPGCTAGESLVSAHMTEAPYETFTTPFTVLPPMVTAPGITVTPATSVEDDYTSSVATIAQVEFPPVDSEKYVNITASQLYDRCLVGPKLAFIGPDGDYAEVGEETSGTVQLDNDGNAFVVLVGSASCAPGTSLIEASLEAKPYKTYTTDYTIEAPRVTEF
jgi:hypothetical protein